MFPVINIGPAAIQANYLILIITFWIGMVAAEKFVEKFKIKSGIFESALTIWLVVFITGARISFILQNLELFIQSPMSIISTNVQLFDFFSGFVFSILAVVIFLQRKKVKLWNFLDASSILIAIISLGVYFANLANGDYVGKETSFFMGIDLWGGQRHPVQIYGMFSAAVTIGISIWILNKYYKKLQEFQDGTLFLFVLSMLSGQRVIIDIFKYPQQIILGFINLDQLVSLVVFMVVSFLFFQRINCKIKHTKLSGNDK